MTPAVFLHVSKQNQTGSASANVQTLDTSARTTTEFTEVSKLLQVSDVDITNAINDNNPGWRIEDIDSRDISVSNHTILSCEDHMIITAMAFTGFGASV